MVHERAPQQNYLTYVSSDAKNEDPCTHRIVIPYVLSQVKYSSLKILKSKTLDANIVLGVGGGGVHPCGRSQSKPRTPELQEMTFILCVFR